MEIISSQDMAFPKGLKIVKPPVKKLYCKGDLTKIDFDKCIAVVGSRRITGYGRRVVEKIIPPLVEAGAVIISGFMYGVDQEAHKTALECGGVTIAVLGWGIDVPPSDADRGLYDKIEKRGLILSEYEDLTQAKLWMFPQRNRIVAGLSQAVIVIEAAEGSGSLITSKLAVKFGKKLFSVPGPITSSLSVGTNSLIKSGSAGLVQDASDILTELKWDISVASGSHPEATGEDSLENKILSLLGDEALDADEIARKVKGSIQEVGYILSLMQIKNLIVEEGSKFYVKMK
jgi:DNA processing protein